MATLRRASAADTEFITTAIIAAESAGDPAAPTSYEGIFGLERNDAPIGITEMEWRAGILTFVPQQIEAVGGVAYGGRHRKQEQRGKDGIGQRVAAAS